MNILVGPLVGGAYGYITAGWLNALNHAGFRTDRWDGTLNSWNEFKPDLYLGCSGHRQNIPSKKQRGNCKIAIHVNPFCDHEIDPNINESADAIAWTSNQQPDAVFGYGYEFNRPNWQKWDEKGIRWVPMATAGDAVTFSPKNGNHNELDIAYIGGRWDYKGINIDKFIVPIMRSNLKSELWGWGKWPPGICKGNAPDEMVPKLLSSAKVGPCVSEPHTNKWGIDIPERMYKVVLSGAIAVHDEVPHMNVIAPSVPSFKSPIEYLEHIKSLCTRSLSERLSIAKRQYSEIFGEHTYHHRLSNLLSQLGFHKQSGIMLQAIKALKV